MANSELLEGNIFGDGHVANTSGNCAAVSSVRRNFYVSDNIYKSSPTRIFSPQVYGKKVLNFRDAEKTLLKNQRYLLLKNNTLRNGKGCG
jgi:hypothetical protein